MRRDMDLVRDLLFAMEADPHGYYQGRLLLKNYTEEQVGYHVKLMMDAGLIEGFEVNTHDKPGPVAIPIRITWKGHEFLDACRGDQRWISAKEIIERVKGVSFDVMMVILSELAKKQVFGA
jgi:hypothetical protein